ncbi:hypothetical protein SCLCIDRAFT_1208392 [Scleroderma citrinum Foug A]|uniref:Uncharacterized protein n=1 Tax=Scleroderma citrinum Foug A TaxID=1036808 RepID=A0A0C3E892_9AGAM|nr:hypothetical protein SCLCIDRAFT_1208392 [Scleroderma citrinum Foug A]
MASLKPPCVPPSVSAGTSIRRKPIFTYRSPAAHISTLYLDKRPLCGISSPSVPSPLVSSTSLAPNTSSPYTSPATIASVNGDLTHRLTFTTDQASSPSYKHPRISTLLPLYHPFGPLALSLPDLDPTTFGLPAPHVMTNGLHINGIFDDPDAASHLRSSNRARRLAVKLRDATEDMARASVPAGGSPALVDVPPVAESEPSVRDKQSPRKRRYGGGGNKRKRRDVDDGDATYPAKRIRNPRSSALASSVPIAGTNTPSPEEVNPSPPTEGGGNEKSRPHGRRSTRARGQAVRRDSTASEATVTSVSVSLTATGAAGNASENMEFEEPISAPTTSKSSNSNAADEAGAPSVIASAERSSQDGDSEEPLETKES